MFIRLFFNNAVCLPKSLQPLFLSVPRDGFGNAAFERVIGHEAQFGLHRRRVANPVALFHDAVLVAVECTRAARQRRRFLGDIRNDPQNEQRHAHRQHEAFVQRTGGIAAELRGTVCPAVGEEVAPPLHPFVDSEKNGFHQIFHIDERDELLAVADRKVEARLNRFHHQEIIFFARTIDTGGAHEHIREIGHCLQSPLGKEFAFPVKGVGARLVVGSYGSESAFVAHAPRAEAAHHDKLVGHAADLRKRGGEIGNECAVDAFEIGTVSAFRRTEIVYDVIPPAHLVKLPEQLFFERLPVAETEVDEMNVPVLEVFAARRGAHARPRFIAPPQGFFYDETADETAGARYQYPFLHIRMILFSKIRRFVQLYNRRGLFSIFRISCPFIR